MPNIKSAKKRVLVIDKKTEQNKAIRSAVKTEIKKVDALIKEAKFDEAKVALSSAFATIDGACTKGIYQKNNASNKKSKLAKKLDAAIKASGVAKEEVKVAPVEEVKVEAPVAEEKPAKKTAAKKTTTAKKTTKKVADKE